MKSIETYQKQFLAYLEDYKSIREPKNLYEPIEYILNLGGKRLRPVLTLMTTDCFEGDTNSALDAALAVEVFHNFSLIHDDIMDAAPLRRGHQTVHEKWDLNTGILSGDAMLIMAYQLFENYPPDVFQNLAILFSKTALEVCEGQQYDIDFETRHDVSIVEYLKMIEYKTAVLVGAAMKMGAIIAGASEEDQNRSYEFGRNPGIAFQLQDDLLDLYADKNKFGKNIGGDIISNKKTFLYLKSLSIANDNQRNNLLTHYLNNDLRTNEKVESVKSIFDELNIYDITKEFISSYHNKAISCLNSVTVRDHNSLNYFADLLLEREV